MFGALEEAAAARWRCSFLNRLPCIVRARPRDVFLGDGPADRVASVEVHSIMNPAPDAGLRRFHRYRVGLIGVLRKQIRENVHPRRSQCGVVRRIARVIGKRIEGTIEGSS